MRKRRKTWFLRRLVLGFAILAVAAPVAQARIDEGTLVEKGIQLNEKFVQGGSTKSVQLNEKFVQGGPSYSLHPVGAPWTVESPSQIGQIHDRPSLGPVGSQYTQFAYRRALPQDYGIRTVEVAGKADGFDWGDAGIGAGTLLGVMLLASGALRARRHVRQPTTT